MITTPCEVCGQPIENVGDGLGTCPSCQTTAPIIAVYTDQKATNIIKQYLDANQNRPVSVEDISKMTNIPTKQVETILDKLSR